MKRKSGLITVLLAILLSSCSYSVEELLLLPTTTPTFTSSPIRTSTNTFTVTPTMPTPTFTETPTLIGAKTPTPTPTQTLTGTATIPFSEITPNTPTPTIAMNGLVSVSKSDDIFYRGKDCEPDYIRFRVIVADPKRAKYVLLSTRFRSKTSGVTSEWTGLTMEPKGAGIYEYDLYPEEMKAVGGYENPWVEYQFIVTTSSRAEIGRTGIFEDRLSLLRCIPTQTPIPTLVPTQTEVKP